VRVRRAGRGVLLEPMFTDLGEWFAELDQYDGSPSWPRGVNSRPRPSERSFTNDVRARHPRVPMFSSPASRGAAAPSFLHPNPIIRPI
jgi:hypothetical protein